MAQNEIVNDWANEMRLNLDRETVGLSVTAFDVPETHSAIGRITIGAGRYVISFNVTDHKYGAKLRVFRLRSGMLREEATEIIETVLDFLNVSNSKGKTVVKTTEMVNRATITRIAYALAA